MVNPADTVAAKAAWALAAIFDFDGTLADTTPRWTAAYECCLRKRGRVADEPTLLALVGASVPEAARTLGIPPAELAAAQTEAFRKRPLTEMPGPSDTSGFIITCQYFRFRNSTSRIADVQELHPGARDPIR